MASKLEKSSELEEILTCSVCLEILSNPFTLKECLHSFCKKCLDGLNRKSSEGATGVECPLCWTFSPEDGLKLSFFIGGLLEAKARVEGKLKPQCIGCPEKPDWTCLDCKLELCDKCKLSHTFIPLLQNHIVKPLSEISQNEVIVDKLIFCSTHHDEPVKFNCKDCETLLCIKCKVIDHESHKTETVESALERLLPQIKANKGKIQVSMEQIDKAIQETKEKLDETVNAFKICSKEIHNKAEKQIEIIRTKEKQLVKDVQLKEEEETARLENHKVNLEHRRNTCQNLCNLVNATVGNARHTSLLAEFQSGLFTKVKDVSVKALDITTLAKIFHPKLISDESLDQSITEMAIGKIEHTLVHMLHRKEIEDSNVSSSVSFCIDENLTPKQWIMDKEISLPNYGSRCTKINDGLWIPVYFSDTLCIYNRDCTLNKTLQCPGLAPKAVVQLSEDAVALACKNTGLYLLNMNGRILQKISRGKYSDIFLYEQCLYAYDYNKYEISMFKNQPPECQLNLSHTFAVSNANSSFYDSIVVCNEMIYLSIFYSNEIKIIKLNGELVNNINCNSLGITGASVCVSDKCHHIIVSGYHSKTLHIWDGQNSMKLVKLDIQPYAIVDCVVDRNYVWTLTETQHHLKRYTLKE